jgi:fructokinase
MDQRIGIDIGGTKTEIAFFRLVGTNAELQIQARERSPTSIKNGYEPWISALAQAISQIAEKQGVDLEKVSFLGLGAPGSLNSENQTLVRSSIPDLSGKQIGDDLVQVLGLPKLPHRLENDANCFLRAEMLYGSGQKFVKETKDGLALGVTVGTGLGGGIWVRGKIFGGHRGLAGELGHTVVRPQGKSCFCGRRGCAERYISGVGIREAYQEKVGPDQAKRASEIFALAEKGDPIATEVIHETKEIFALLLGNLINALDPDLIILGGGVSNQPLLLDGMQALLNKGMFYGYQAPPLLRHTLGDSAGSIGAALID